MGMALSDRVLQEDVELLFDPSLSDEPMHTVAFASGSGTNFREAVTESRIGRDFSVDYVLTDRALKGKDPSEWIGALDYAVQFGIPADVVNGYAMCGSWKAAQATPEGKLEYERRCQAFNQELLDKVEAFEKAQKHPFDLAILAGYMRLFKDPLLQRFTNRAINVHPAVLSVLKEDGERRYVGANAVYDALKAGERRTRSSIILVAPKIDAGEILVSGPWLAYKGLEEITPEEADKHQDEQKRVSDWPALRFALRAIAKGEFGLHKKKTHPDGNRVVVYQGQEMPYQGVELPLEEIES